MIGRSGAVWFDALFEGLVAAGVDDVVLSPGSRSTPFVLAALRAGLRCHDIVDERSAGFFALGRSRAIGGPTLLLCTSGTAPAHYLPAVLEAEAAQVPLVVLSADRPNERREAGAPQTIDQVKLYGDRVRGFFELEAPSIGSQGHAPSGHGFPRGERSLRAVRRRAAQAVALALAPLPGPVHLNAPARKPLEPGPGEPMTARRGERETSPAPRFFVAELGPCQSGVEALAEKLRHARRPLVVAGAAPLPSRGHREALLTGLHRLGAPVYAEVSSQLRYLPAGAPLVHWVHGLGVLLEIEPFRERLVTELAPDLVVQLGAPPLSSGWEPFLESAAADHVVISSGRLLDPVSTCSLWLDADPGVALPSLLHELSKGPVVQRDPEWRNAVERASELAAARVREQLAAEQVLSELEVAKRVIEALPEGGLLALGNSLPVRLAESVLDASAGDRRVWVQRGVNGIDGLVSGVAGSVLGLAQIGVVPPTALLIGDLSLQHDLGGLDTLRHLRPLGAPFVIVVLQNAGGRIFEQLPIAQRGLQAEELALWTTPRSLDLEAAARTFGLAYHRVARRSAAEAARGVTPDSTPATTPDAADELSATLHAVFSGTGSAAPLLLEVEVPTSGAAELRRRLLGRIERSVHGDGR